MDELEVDITILDDIKQPTLFDVNKSFDIIKTKNYNGVVGEETARMVIFTNFILGQKPVILKGSRSTGKTNLMCVVGEYAKNPLIIASSSEKGYQRMEKINEHSHIIIPEINKIHDKTIEMLKDFGEGESHRYTFLDDWKQPKTIEIKPRPFMTSIADENKNVDGLGEELLSRLTIVRTDGSIQQNIRVIKEKLKRAENPFNKNNIGQEEVEQYINYVKTLPNIEEFVFINPCAQAIRKAIPPIFSDSRRDTDKYLSNINGITLFHYPDRIQKKIKGKNCLFVTPADVWYNHVIYQSILLESSLKCGRIEQEILKILKEMGMEERQTEFNQTTTGLKASEIHNELLKRSFSPTIASVKIMCNQLVETGYVTRDEEVRPYRFTINTSLDRDYEVDINWKEVIEECKKSIRENFPDIADEYIKKYCEGDGLRVIHPFGGVSLYIDTQEIDGMYIGVDLAKKPEKISEEVFKKYKQPKEPDPVDDGGVVDETDQAEDIILTCLREKKKALEVTEISSHTNLSDTLIEDTLNYLQKIAAVIKDGHKWRILE